MKLSDKAYIIMKWSSLLAIPLVTLVLSISDAIGWNAGSVVAAISNDNYYNNGDE